MNIPIRVTKRVLTFAAVAGSSCIWTTVNAQVPRGLHYTDSKSFSYGGVTCTLPPGWKGVYLSAKGRFGLVKLRKAEPLESILFGTFLKSPPDSSFEKENVLKIAKLYKPAAMNYKPSTFTSGSAFARVICTWRKTSHSLMKAFGYTKIGSRYVTFFAENYTTDDIGKFGRDIAEVVSRTKPEAPPPTDHYTDSRIVSYGGLTCTVPPGWKGRYLASKRFGFEKFQGGEPVGTFFYQAFLKSEPDHAFETSIVQNLINAFHPTRMDDHSMTFTLGSNFARVVCFWQKSPHSPFRAFGYTKIGSRYLTFSVANVLSGDVGQFRRDIAAVVSRTKLTIR